ncbi:sorbitol dehydrogenase (L-iditol 2-dehydrogenase) [Halosimplex carlsbadense 2-9-1]|uniref:Sorbitol dehydrogenase (L-iditol 2-dehydrogenase) n=1 Tax=Halosimplex carlsbadense 2-9-1 TaxID=797114 RepID=M0CC73_9EURY|nr:sorbitol dehydrogenase (L-iditol 2-dehydrogenase) [Halosimplex carlsbadense 2-9-1]
MELQELERPSIDPDEVLVNVHSAGVCGSDAHAYEYDNGYEWIQIPRIMGHEYSGEVVEVGADVDAFRAGDKIIEEPIHDCGDCFQCKNGQPNVCQNFSITGMHRDGAYAEYVAVDPSNLHAVPEAVPLRHAAITEPTSIATRAVLDQSTTRPGDDVLVEGPGPIGVLIATVADSLGANVVVSGLDQDAEYRLPLLNDLGIETINVQAESLDGRTDAVTGGRGFDVVFDSTGHHSGIGTAVEQVRKGGQIVVVGIPNDTSEVTLTSVVRGEVDVNTSYGSTWSNFEQALRLMERGEIPVDEIIDTSYGTGDPSDAFEAFLNGETCKPVFQFSA